MPYYCHLDSSGSVDHTNLQLYSLQKAADEWNGLVNLVADHEDNDNVQLRGLTFIINCLGLSLSQLLGQNTSSEGKDKIEHPGTLLGTLLTRAKVDRETRRRLNSSFQDFLSYYGAVRHFGANKNKKNYRIVDQLTLWKLNQFRCMTIEIWDIVISFYRKTKGNDIEEFKSVSDIVGFRDLANQSTNLTKP